VASNETFDFAGPAGRLEAILMLPEAPPSAAAVVCHAHPLHGGMMHFKVVFRAAKALQSAGLAVLRFNFRGVGRSEGLHDHGSGEQEDARAALREMRDRFPGLPLLLGGFSFGSAVALRVAAREERVRAVFALGYPLLLSFRETPVEPVPRNPPGLQTHSHLAEVLQPRLFVQGENDEFGPGETLRALVLELPREIVVIPGADHFFGEKLDALQGAIADWAERRPWDADSPP
jgi:alpha/beta superfamily hydrolase